MYKPSAFFAAVVAAVTFGLQAPAADAEVLSFDFVGFIEPGGGFFPPNIDTDFEPVSGSVSIDLDAPFASNLANGKRYVDAAGSLTADFGPGGSLFSFSSLSEIRMEVTHVSGYTRFYIEAFDTPVVGEGNRLSLTLPFPGENALGPDFPLPSGPFTFEDFGDLTPRGGIAGGGALSTFEITAIPEPAGLGLLGLTGLFTLRRRNRGR